ncbi:MAG: MaoC family dehydratase [Actinomycetota bacterium]|nr:MaoC family dehydratase [Acidimicrobiia bacterium]MDQ3294010.1 MaoC family dehydratase [Actinomycetota bacterium]
MLTVTGADGLKDLVGQHIGWSDPFEITQQQVNTFAEATGDHQWIHVDPERAKTGPFGGPIAHGYLTLSLLPYFLPLMWRVEGFKMGVNYGAEKVRFPAPVPVGSQVRCGATVDSVDDVGGGVQVTLTGTIEVVGAPKPSCVAQAIYRYYE